MNPNEQNLIKIQVKIIQVLRIKKQLGSRREYYLQQLNSARDIKETLGILSSLQHIYKREEKVIGICEKGLIASLKILADVEGVISSSGNFWRQQISQVKNIRSRIPIIGKKYGGEESLIFLLKLMYQFIKKEIIYIEKELHKIKESIKVQYEYLLIAISKVEKEDISGNVIETKYFKKIEKFHQEELFIIKEIEKTTNSKKSKMIMIINRMNILLNRHQRVFGLQAALIAAPTPTMFATAGSLFLGPQVAPLFFLIGNFVSYSPAITLLGFYGTKYLLKKIPINKIPIKDIAGLKYAMNQLTKRPAFVVPSI